MNTIEYGQGAVNNTIGWGQGAKVGSSFSNLNSFSFDGIDDFFSGDTTYTQLNTSQHFTISFWIKYVGGGSPSGGAKNLFQFSGDSYINAYLRDEASGNYLDFSVGSTANYVRSAVGSITDNTWHHICWTYDGTQTRFNRYNLFIDAVQSISSDNGTTITSIATFPDFFIGKPFEPNTFMDEFSIFNQTLTSTQVSEIYNSGVPNSLTNLPTAPSPVTWFRMGDDNASWDGSNWSMSDVVNSYSVTSANMLEANKTTDVPT
jgi:hypothetical protein